MLTDKQKAAEKARRAANKARREAARTANAAGKPDPAAGQKVFGLPYNVVMIPFTLFVTLPVLGFLGWGFLSSMTSGSGSTYDNGLGDTWRCEAQLKKTLKDPGSYQYDTTIHTPQATIVKYRSKNAFGGYVPGSFSCAK